MDNELTPDEIKRLTALWLQKTPELSGAEIGRILGRTKNSALAKVHRLGLHPREALPGPARKLAERQSRPAPALASPRACQWIEGDSYKADIAAGRDPHCGKPSVPGRPYCATHDERSRAAVQPEPKVKARAWW